MHVTEEEIRELAPYEGEEFRSALARVLESPVLPSIVETLFPKVQLPEFKALVRSLGDADAFQAKIIAPAIKSLLKRTSGGLTTSGFDRLPKGSTHLFLSNHRDIVCDPALFNVALWQHGLRTAAICLGDNLLKSAWTRDLIKVNKGITVKRNLGQRELLHWSVALSTLVGRSVRADGQPIWLAQREGRAKDGDDRTHPGVLKMLSLTGDAHDPLERLEALRIVPVSISYELDPCDAIKARETWLTARDGRYEKAPGEDQRSMVLGIQGGKGRIHVAVAEELPEAFAYAREADNRKERLARLAERFDQRIHADYKLWPTNYIAYDLLAGGTAMRRHYTEEDQRVFGERMDKQLALVAADEAERAAIRPYFLALYANPVRNALAVSGAGA